MWFACPEVFYKTKIPQCTGCLLYDRKVEEFKDATLNDRLLQLFRKMKWKSKWACLKKERPSRECKKILELKKEVKHLLFKNDTAIILEQLAVRIWK